MPLVKTSERRSRSWCGKPLRASIESAQQLLQKPDVIREVTKERIDHAGGGSPQQQAQVEANSADLGVKRISFSSLEQTAIHAVDDIGVTDYGLDGLAPAQAALL